MRTTLKVFGLLLLASAWIAVPGAVAQEGSQIVHDAEYYILDAQNGQQWAVEDGELDAKLAELRQRYGTPPQNHPSDV